MADTTPATSSAPAAITANGTSKPGPKPQTKFQKLNALYALPAPLRTYPLPTFHPTNPLSLFHILYTYISQTLSPTPSHLSPLYLGFFSAETRSVQVTDERSIRGLWEQGFYGKGTLSRSEPAWMEREGKRKGGKGKVTSEMVTKKRREERMKTKWERARKEREEIEDRLRAESTGVEGIDALTVPVEIAADVPAPALVQQESRDLSPESVSPPPVLESSSSESVDPALQPLSEVFSAPATPQADVEVPIAISPVISSPVLPNVLSIKAPVGPLELLALPNSYTELELLANGLDEILDASTVVCHAEQFDEKFTTKSHAAPVGPLELLALPNSMKEYLSTQLTLLKTIDPVVSQVPVTKAPEPVLLPSPLLNANGSPKLNGLEMNGHAKLSIADHEILGGSETNDDVSTHSDTTTETNGTAPEVSVTTNGHPSTPRKHRKSVRFSPTIEKNTFIQSEPPSPSKALGASIPAPSPSPFPAKTSPSAVTMPEPEPEIEAEVVPIKQQEHLQLTLEEAFFLSYSLGVLNILDPSTNQPIPNSELFTLFRRSSYFPPIPSPTSTSLQPKLSPDDPFLMNYVVYHHYRSLGWVIRSGIKFSVDYMLYIRGPVFTHAEFGLLILPSYSDPYWRSTPELVKYVGKREGKSWDWLGCVNRVIGQVRKTLVLCYVDVPKPWEEGEEAKVGVDGVLGRYKVKEVVLKRWSANRVR